MFKAHFFLSFVTLCSYTLRSHYYRLRICTGTFWEYYFFLSYNKDKGITKNYNLRASPL